MFEFLMLIGFLWAGLCHWQPRRTKNESVESERMSRGKNERDAKITPKCQGRQALRARIASA